MNQSSILMIYMSVLLIIILFIRWWLVRRKVAIEKVKERTDEQKLKDINEALSLYGFLFDIRQDIVYSSMYPQQRKLGYCKLYDELAPSLNMIIDCEPIYFKYDGRRWLIEFWKGQYGMTTGGEVGVYVTDKEDIDIPGVFSGAFYESVSDNELLKMKYILKKDGKEIIKRKEKHWWLTGFDVGIFSKAEQLSLEIQITFPNSNMQKAFIIGLGYAGYTTKDVTIVNKTVKVIFKTPKTKQPQKYRKWVKSYIQMLNRFYCKLFNWVTKDFTRTVDKIDFLRLYYPILFRLIANSKRAKRIQKLYEEIQKSLKE